MEQPKIPVVDTIDMEILMHRDVHFGGSFHVMIEYYQRDGVGTFPDFSIKRIKKLQHIEVQMTQNLSKLYLPDKAQEIVKESLQLYHDLRNVYSSDNKDTLTQLLSDLILSEEENPEKEMQALINQGEKALPALIHLLSSSHFYDPLYPGYGRTPIFSAKCLAAIRDERAISPLFEALNQENFFTDEEMIKALVAFGDQSKSFLLKRLKQFPLSKDNEHAAIVLNSFPEDEEIASCSLEMLEKEAALNSSLANYLVFCCSNLIKKKERERFISLSKKEGITSPLFNEMAIVIKHWKSTA